MNNYDGELIARFVGRTDHLTLKEAAALIGVTHESVRRYRTGEVESLRATTRTAMEMALALFPDPDVDGYHQGLRYAAERLHELATELERLTEPAEADLHADRHEDYLEQTNAADAG